MALLWGSFVDMVNPLIALNQKLEKTFEFKENGYVIRIGWDLIEDNYFGVLYFDNDTDHHISEKAKSIGEVCERMLLSAKQQHFSKEVREKLFEVYCKSGEMEDFYNSLMQII